MARVGKHLEHLHLAQAKGAGGERRGVAGELALAERFAATLGVPFSSTRVDVRAGPNLMARAREARYAALEAALLRWTEKSPRARGADRVIATGHHADDRAETVLIRLLCGTGPTGLGVLPPRAAHLVRPLIRACRTDIVAHVERHRVPYAEDPTNRDPRFLRTRVRRELMPLLTELSPRIVEHLCDLADAAQNLAEGAGPDVPGVVEGHRLGRAQRIELARALKNRNPRARVPISGGRIAAIDLSTRRIVLIKGR